MHVVLEQRPLDRVDWVPAKVETNASRQGQAAHNSNRHIEGFHLFATKVAEYSADAPDEQWERQGSCEGFPTEDLEASDVEVSAGHKACHET